VVKFEELPEWRQEQIKKWVDSLGTFRVGNKDVLFDVNATDWAKPTVLQKFWHWIGEIGGMNDRKR